MREVRRQDSVITVTRDTAEMILLPEDHEADTMAIKEMDSMKENKKGRKYSLLSVQCPQSILFNKELVEPVCVRRRIL